jgi:hypothetical protein
MKEYGCPNAGAAMSKRPEMDDRNALVFMVMGASIP